MLLSDILLSGRTLEDALISGLSSAILIAVEVVVLVVIFVMFWLQLKGGLVTRRSENKRVAGWGTGLRGLRDAWRKDNESEEQKAAPVSLPSFQFSL